MYVTDISCKMLEKQFHMFMVFTISVNKENEIVNKDANTFINKISLCLWQFDPCVVCGQLPFYTCMELETQQKGCNKVTYSLKIQQA